MIYQTHKINAGSYYINDEQNDSSYLLVGKDSSIMIDCGLFKHPIMPTINTIVNQDVGIILTHGHGDHVGRLSEFNNIFISSKEKEVYLSNTEAFDNIDLLDFNRFRYIKDHQEFNLGDRIIEAIELPGHTPGSIIIIDSSYKTIYTGDAIGSGCGVWMQLPNTLSISQYRDNLNNVIHYLEYKGVDDEWLFYGGHNTQETSSRISSFNKLDFQLLKDMAVLCDKLLNNDISGIETQEPTYTDEQAYYVSYGKAELIYKKSNLI